MTSQSPKPDPDAETKNPKLKPWLAFTICAVAVILGFFVPAGLANYGHVFYSKDVLKRVDEIDPEAARQFKDQSRRDDQLSRQIDQIDDKIAKLDPERADFQPTLKPLSDARKDLQSIPTGRYKIRISGFYLNLQMFLWVVEFAMAGFLAFILSPRIHSKGQIFRAMCRGLAIYAFIQWPHWFRNFEFTHTGRRVFSYVNQDIHFGSFLYQEVSFLMFCVALGIVWTGSLERAEIEEHERKESEHKESEHKESERKESERKELELPTQTMLDLSESFREWMVCSVALALCFIYFTTIYWRNVVINDDMRYISSAVSVHAMWGATWWVTSRRLFDAWLAWEKARADCAKELAQAALKGNAGASTAIAALNDMKPVDPWSLFGSGVLAFAAYFGPFIQAMLRVRH